MATIQFKKGDEYLAKISKLEALAKDEVIGGAIYGAASIVADEIRKELDKVPTDERYGTQSEPANGPKKGQIKGLEDNLGIAKMQDDGTGYIHVKIGWNGYNHIKTKRWPNGQPNQMIARSIARGTSYMTGHDFVKKAVSATKKRAIQYMKDIVDQKTEEIMKGT